MTQFLDEAGLALFWKKVKAKLPYDPQTVAEKNTQLVEKDITSMYTDGSLFENVKSGHFDGINPGNYFNARVKDLYGDGTICTFVVLELDRYYGKTDNTGNSKTQHHIVVTTKETELGNAKMNSSKTNNGGYIGSDMFKTTIPKVDSTLQSRFGAHLKTVSLNLSNTGYNQKPYTYVNTLVKSYLFTEYEVFGGGEGYACDDEKYTAYPQYAAFKLDPSLRFAGILYWERSVSNNATDFCVVDSDSGTNSNTISNQGASVRPAFLLG